MDGEMNIFSHYGSESALIVDPSVRIMESERERMCIMRCIERATFSGN